jgi:hypothetical protein
MSRGFGRRQCDILQAVQAGWVYLRHLLPTDATHAEYQALHRAACRLFDQGKLDMFRYMSGHRKVAIGPVGIPCPYPRKAIRGHVEWHGQDLVPRVRDGMRWYEPAVKVSVEKVAR